MDLRCLMFLIYILLKYDVRKEKKVIFKNKQLIELKFVRKEINDLGKDRVKIR